MDVKQNGPALFPTVKQVRRMLEGDHLPPVHTRRSESSQPAPDETASGIGK